MRGSRRIHLRRWPRWQIMASLHCLFFLADEAVKRGPEARRVLEQWYQVHVLMVGTQLAAQRREKSRGAVSGQLVDPLA